MKKSIIKKYAKTIVKIGANVQKGQDVVITCCVDQSIFAGYVVEECYKAGARKVSVEWNTPACVLIPTVKYESIDTLSEIPNWQIEKRKYLVEKLPAHIHIVSEAPDEFLGLDTRKSSQARMKKYPILKPYIDAMECKYQWTIAGVPSEKWAKKVFPNLSKNQAIEALWEAILHTARITDDPIKSWNEHNENLLNRCKYLNSFEFDYLEYHAENGTDFKVWMCPNCIWCGGGETTLGTNIYFNPNMPTEECFTTPIKGKAEGKVVASKPLSYNGQLIENFWFEFKDGKVVNYDAEKGKDVLEEMLNMDEAASYLGECALVPFESPINETGILFYDTLYDENAVCHLALGMGFQDVVKDHEKYTKEDFDKMGINDSMIHVDFMIGTRDMSITGVTKDGKKVPIFVNGTWA